MPVEPHQIKTREDFMAYINKQVEEIWMQHLSPMLEEIDAAGSVDPIALHMALIQVAAYVAGTGHAGRKTQDIGMYLEAIKANVGMHDLIMKDTIVKAQKH